jgi:hypothetical protein
MAGAGASEKCASCSTGVQNGNVSKGIAIMVHRETETAFDVLHGHHDSLSLDVGKETLALCEVGQECEFPTSACPKVQAPYAV